MRIIYKGAAFSLELFLFHPTIGVYIFGMLEHVENMISYLTQCSLNSPLILCCDMITKLHCMSKAIFLGKKFMKHPKDEIVVNIK